MRKPHGFRIGILMLMFAVACRAFHLQGQPSVRRAVCASAPPCCPGHICRAYQRFDASRPVAACATGLQARPLYAPGSPAQRRLCGSTSRDMFSQRLGSRDQGLGRQLIGQRSFPGMAGFPGQVGNFRQLSRASPRQRFSDRRFPTQGGRAQMTSFAGRSRFDPSFSSRSMSGGLSIPRSRSFRSRPNTLASLPEERLQFGLGRSQLSQSRGSFPSSRGLPAFPGSQDQFSVRSRSGGRTGFGQGLSISQQRPGSRGRRQGLTEGQQIIEQLSQFPVEQLSQGSSFPSGDRSQTDQSFGFQEILPAGGSSLTAGSRSIEGQAVTFQDTLPRGSAFTSRDRTVDTQSFGFTDSLPQAETPQTFASQPFLPPSGASQSFVPPSSASQPFVPPSGASQAVVPQSGTPSFGAAQAVLPSSAAQPLFPPGGASQPFFPRDGVPQPLLVETPPVSRTPIKSSVADTSNIVSKDLKVEKLVVGQLSANVANEVPNQSVIDVVNDLGVNANPTIVKTSNDKNNALNSAKI